MVTSNKVAISASTLTGISTRQRRRRAPARSRWSDRPRLIGELLPFGDVRFRCGGGSERGVVRGDGVRLPRESALHGEVLRHAYIEVNTSPTRPPGYPDRIRPGRLRCAPAGCLDSPPGHRDPGLGERSPNPCEYRPASARTTTRGTKCDERGGPPDSGGLPGSGRGRRRGTAVPQGLLVGCRHRGVPDRGRRSPRTAARRPSGTPSPRTRPDRRRRHRATSPADHYHRYREDVALMRDLGLDRLPVLRLLVPRSSPTAPARQRSAVSPSTTGWSTSCWRPGIAAHGTRSTTGICRRRWRISAAGAAATPPRASASTPAVVADRLGDRVPLWFTLNEPWCSAFLGYGSGHHAPGRREPRRRPDRHAPPAARARAGRYAPCGPPPRPPGSRSHSTRGAVRPVSDSPADLAAARRIDGLLNRAFLDPVLCGSYPADVVARHRRRQRLVLRPAGDLDVISSRSTCWA